MKRWRGSFPAGWFGKRQVASSDIILPSLGRDRLNLRKCLFTAFQILPLRPLPPRQLTPNLVKLGETQHLTLLTRSAPTISNLDEGDLASWLFGRVNQVEARQPTHSPRNWSSTPGECHFKISRTAVAVVNFILWFSRVHSMRTLKVGLWFGIKPLSQPSIHSSRNTSKCSRHFLGRDFEPNSTMSRRSWSVNPCHLLRV